MTDHKAYLVIDVGGTYLKSAILNKEGEVFEGSALMSRACSEGSKEEILGAISETILTGLSFLKNKKLSLYGIGMAFPGPSDYRKGIPLMEHKFKNIHGVDLREYIAGIPGVSSEIPIRFKHDADAVLEGEQWKGNAQEYNNAAVVTLGTGLGFFFSQNRINQCNSLGGPVLSIFKLPCKDGILEDYASKRGFIKIYKELSGKKDKNIKVSDIGRWADEGDEDSLRTFSYIGTILAESLLNIIIEREIQCLLFGGQISLSFRHMEASLKRGLKGAGCLKLISSVSSIENSALLGVLKTIIE